MGQFSNENGLEISDQEISQEDIYEVQRILDKKRVNGKVKYLVEWVGYPNEADFTWEPISNLENIQNMINEFEAKLEQQKEIKQKKVSEKKIVSDPSSKSNENNFLQKKTSRYIDDEISKEDISHELTHSTSIKSVENSNQQELSIEDQFIIGSFEEGDIPLKIVHARILQEKKLELNCLIQWTVRKDGITPNNTWISSQIIRKKAPELLIDFYEARVRLPKLPK
jgi:hypothetical protein